MNRRVKIMISRQALRDNLATVRRIVGPETRIFAVVKADAYGHGSVEVARSLHDPALQAGSGATPTTPDGFAVVTPGEAIEIRQAGINTPILVLQGAASHGELQQAQDHGLWLVVHDHRQLRMLADWQAAQTESAVESLPTLPIWVKFDTGMGRLGFDPREASQILGKLGKPGSVRVTGLISHFACADDPGNAHTRQQIDSFLALPDVPGTWRSLANSAGILAWPDSHSDWVRAGLMLYGAEPLTHHLSQDQQRGNIDRAHDQTLIPAMQVTAPLVAVKSVPAGCGIGYGQTYRCRRDSIVGFAGIGYGDGLPRRLENAWMSVNGSLAPVIGRVSMDSVALDLTGVSAAPGDTVVVFGWDGLPVEFLAKAAGTISYELLCQISGQRVWL